jgi:hypothetical protein
MAIQPSIVTRDVDKIAAPTGNLYESVVVISKRARQIAVNLKEELNNKLAEFATTSVCLSQPQLLLKSFWKVSLTTVFVRQPSLKLNLNKDAFG